MMEKECFVFVEGGTRGDMPVNMGNAGAVTSSAALVVSLNIRSPLRLPSILTQRLWVLDQQTRYYRQCAISTVSTRTHFVGKFS